MMSKEVQKQEDGNNRRIIAIILIIIVTIIILLLLLRSCENTSDKEDKKLGTQTEEKKDKVEGDEKDKEKDQKENKVVDDEIDNNFINYYRASTKRNDNLYLLALNAVVKAENSLLGEDISMAEKLVNNLPNGIGKGELDERLEAIHLAIYADEIISRLENMIAEAQNKGAIDFARAYEQTSNIEALVNSLTLPSIKENLLYRLTKIDQVLGDKDKPVVSGIDTDKVNYSVILSITDANEVSATLNGDPYVSGTEITEEGEYQLVAVDSAFNKTEVTFIIDLTAPELTVDTSDTTITIGSEYREIDYSANDNFDGDVTNNVVVEYYYQDETGEFVAIDGIDTNTLGIYKVVYKVTDESGNEIEASRIVEVVKIETEIELEEPSSLEYDGQAKEYIAVLKNKITGDRIDEIALTPVYKNESGVKVAPIDVGTYSVSVYFGGNDTYKASYLYTTFEITQAEITVNLKAPVSLEYDGQPKEYTIETLDKNGNNITGLSCNTVYSGNNYPSTNVAPTDVGTYKVATYCRGNKNYIPKYATTEFEITQAEITVNLKAPVSLEYDGQPKEYTIETLDKNGNNITGLNCNTVYSGDNYPSTNVAPTDVGTYKVATYCRGNKNYIPKYATTEFEITQAEITVNLVAPNLEYDGQPKEYTIETLDKNGNNITGLNCNTVYSGNNYSSTNVAPTDVGTYKVATYCRGNKNYIPKYATTGFEITQAEITVNLVAPNLEYDGQPKEYTIETLDKNGNNITGLSCNTVYSGNNYSSSNVAPTEKGTYEVATYCRGNNNYVPKYQKVTFSIIDRIVRISDYSSIIDAINNLTDGDTIILDQDVSEDFTINKTIKIDGQQSSVISGHVTVTAPDVELTGIEFSGITTAGGTAYGTGGGSVIDVKTDGKFTFTNNVVKNVSSYAYNVLKIQAGDIVTIKNNRFEDSNNSTKYVYNTIEFSSNSPLVSGSEISDNYFSSKNGGHNMINIYNIEEGATININNNIFEYSANAVRLSNKTSHAATINMKNNRYNSTDSDLSWAGFIIFQPWPGYVNDYSKYTINIENLVGPIGNIMTENVPNSIDQIYYGWENSSLPTINIR